MNANERFLRQPKSFWAHVRTISQQVGYTLRGKGQIKTPTLTEVKSALHETGLSSVHIADAYDRPTELGETLVDYFKYRAHVLNSFVEPHLMDGPQARSIFEELLAKLSPTCPMPMNKQKGDKKMAAYLTCIVNMLIEHNSEGLPCDYDPHQLTTITRNGIPVRTLARRIDGAFTSSINPIAVWEVKEYYYTTTFGSRVADGIYESLLDGMEIDELRSNEGIDIKHYLMVDSHYTWWECGRSYLCRLIDMLHMGYIDEVLFGREVVDRLPSIVREWVSIAQKRD